MKEVHVIIFIKTYRDMWKSGFTACSKSYVAGCGMIIMGTRNTEYRPTELK